MSHALSSAEIHAFLATPVAFNASRSDAAVCGTWPCHGPGCARRWTRPTRSHDGASCHVCRRSKAESDAFRDGQPTRVPLNPALSLRRFQALPAFRVSARLECAVPIPA